MTIRSQSVGCPPSYQSKTSLLYSGHVNCIRNVPSDIDECLAQKEEAAEIKGALGSMGRLGQCVLRHFPRPIALDKVHQKAA